MGINNNRWRPWPQDGLRHFAQTKDLIPGDVVLDVRTPYRVTAIHALPFADWPGKYLDLWLHEGEPDPVTWWKRPFDFDLEPALEPGTVKRLRGPANAAWTALPEHFTVCWTCREIPPCQHTLTEKTVQAATGQMEFALSLLPGCCHACGEPVTQRQKRVVFDGENLIRGDLGPAVFHTRRDCLSGAEAYDERWADAAPGRCRKLSCPGRLMEHADGSVECSHSPACPDVGLHHPLWEQHFSGDTPLWKDGHAPWAGCWCLAGESRTSIPKENS